MLRKLINYHLIMNKKVLVINFVLYCLYFIWIAGEVHSVNAYLIFGCIMAGILPITIMVREDKFKAVAAGCSLPVTRTDQVKARLILTWLLALVTLVCFWSFPALVPGSKIQPGLLFSVDKLSLSLTLLTIILAFLLPFVFRFGITGLLIFLAVFQGLGALALLLTFMHSSILDFRILEDCFRQAIIAFRSLQKLPAFLLLLAAALFLINFISYRVDLWLFRRREL